MDKEPKLFSEVFEAVNTDANLQLLFSKFPDYDPGYLCLTAGLPKRTKKAWVENLWIQYAPHADSNFKEAFKRNFAQRSWELYIGVTLLNRGFRLGKHSNAGPDFRVEDKNGTTLAWVEAVAPNKGSGDNRVPDTVYDRGSTVNVPEEKMLLRLSSVLSDKYKKYGSDVAKGIVRADEPFVIAINRSDLEHIDTLLPMILHVVLAIGHLTLQIKVGGVRQENPKSTWTMRQNIKKSNGEDIPMFFFMDDAYAGISAVVYCEDSILNSPHLSHEMGENFVVVHNPYAKNPLPAGFFPFGEEYRAESEHVVKIRKRKEWTNNQFDFLMPPTR